MSLSRGERDGRPNAVWRLLLTGLLLAVTTILFSAVLSPIAFLLGVREAAPTPTDGAFIPPGILLTGSLASLAATFLSISVACRWLDRRPLADLGLRLTPAWWADLGFGLLLGVAAIGVAFAIEIALGWVEITGFGPTEGGGAFLVELLIALVIFGSVGVYEELIMRGYVMKNIAEGLNSSSSSATVAVYAGLVLSAAIFALPHIFNPGASFAGILNILGSGVLVLGLGYALTGRLGLPIGVHISWNFAQGFLFGLPTSGAVVGRYPVLMTEQTGPALMTGGAFGLEGGALGTLALIVACAATLIWAGVREGRLSIHEEIAEPPVSSQDQGRASGEDATPLPEQPDA
ncbi:MAG: CPBP family intramembrane glutamic endopeptidase [Armatimonadota bacterium]